MRDKKPPAPALVAVDVGNVAGTLAIAVIYRQPVMTLSRFFNIILLSPTFSHFDDLVKSRNSDGFVKSPGSRLANPEE